MLKTPSCPWRSVPGSRSKFGNWTTVPSLYSWNIADVTWNHNRPTNQHCITLCKVTTNCVATELCFKFSASLPLSKTRIVLTNSGYIHFDCITKRNNDVNDVTQCQSRTKRNDIFIRQSSCMQKLTFNIASIMKFIVNSFIHLSCEKSRYFAPVLQFGKYWYQHVHRRLVFKMSNNFLSALWRISLKCSV